MNQLLLLDWLTYHNLPFNLVNSERFSGCFSITTHLSRRADTTGKTLVTLLMDEYSRALGPVHELLREREAMMYGSKRDDFNELLVHWGDKDFMSEEDEQRRYENPELEIIPEEDQDEWPGPRDYQRRAVDKIPQVWAVCKLHNIGVALRTSSQLLETFTKLNGRPPPLNRSDVAQNVCTRGI
ncbi:hypothetical protein FPOA_13653 [Fusarium poae]|uniref:HAT C-terminal dimerisation domain-containing protein n=1 Tax=Fusarium poae TaxID=36050 RepID=A0A1B8A4Y4_FUSPO|nr:hypothetical protein FPOA_13653 [Fusarium poae]